MRFSIPLLLLTFRSLAAEAPIADIRYKISAGDLLSADQINDEYCRLSGATSECADGWAWIARGAFYVQHYDLARTYLSRARSITDTLDKSRLPDDSYLAAAIGAEIEVEAQLLAVQGQRVKALASLQAQRGKWKLYSIEARIQKNINMFTLVGKPAPPAGAELGAAPTLLFLWGHWCSDCTGEAPTIARIRNRFETRGLKIVAPTRRNGTAGENEHASPGEEDAEIERVWKASYPGLEGLPHPVSTDVMLAYGVSSTPTLVLVDRSGIVRLYQPYRMSEAELAKRIDAILK